MADTSESEATPVQLHNGTTEEEDERLKQRPADIDADVREMERRKRVEAIMSSKLFREELERVLDARLRGGDLDTSLLQHIGDIVGVSRQPGSFKSGNCVLPINDIRGVEGFAYDKGEKILRCKLAAAYRLVDLFGWSHGVNITARLNGDEENFLVSPRGLLPHEVTASSLAKVDMQANTIDPGTTNFSVGKQGFSVHAWVHAARPDARCVLAVRCGPAVAVSSLKAGILPLTSDAALLGEVSYHSPPSLWDSGERESLTRALGPRAHVLVLHGSGVVCCGATVEEAFHYARSFVAAADSQLRVSNIPTSELHLLDVDSRRRIYEQSRAPPPDRGSNAKWRVGGDHFEGLMRMLDNAGYRTGYVYRNPLVKNDVPRPRNDVEVPPAVSSLGYLLEEEELYRQGIWRKLDKRAPGDRTRWLNSPNVYQKVELLETGTDDPKKITKWVADDSPAHGQGTPVRIESALQFVPKNTNPKEFKQLQQQIKDNRRADKISAGPQSHILEGVTWDEAAAAGAAAAAAATDAAHTHTADHVVLMGAASKGIIQRGHQHDAAVYRAPYATNPFDRVNDAELAAYKRTVEGGGVDLQRSLDVTSPETATETADEDESRDEPRVLRIETKQVPRASQPEVVLSDDSANLIAMEINSSLLTSSPNHSRPEDGAHPGSYPKCKRSLMTKLEQCEEELGAASTVEKLNLDFCEDDDRAHSVRSYESTSDTHASECIFTDSSPHRTATLDRSSQRYPSPDFRNALVTLYSSNRSIPSYSKFPYFRSRSHSASINSYINDPNPKHFHLPESRLNVFAGFQLKNGLKTALYKYEQCKQGNIVKLIARINEIPIVGVKREETQKLQLEEYTLLPSPDPLEMYYIDECSSSEINIQVEQNDKPKNISEHKSNGVDGETVSYEPLEQYDNGDYLNFNDLEYFDSSIQKLFQKDIRSYILPAFSYLGGAEQMMTSQQDEKCFKGSTTHRSPSGLSDTFRILESIPEESRSTFDDSNDLSIKNGRISEESNDDCLKYVTAIVDDVIYRCIEVIQSKVNLLSENIYSIKEIMQTHLEELNNEISPQSLKHVYSGSNDNNIFFDISIENLKCKINLNAEEIDTKESITELDTHADLSDSFTYENQYVEAATDHISLEESYLTIHSEINSDQRNTNTSDVVTVRDIEIRTNKGNETYRCENAILPTTLNEDYDSMKTNNCDLKDLQNTKDHLENYIIARSKKPNIRKLSEESSVRSDSLSLNSTLEFETNETINEIIHTIIDRVFISVQSANEAVLLFGVSTFEDFVSPKKNVAHFDDSVKENSYAQYEIVDAVKSLLEELTVSLESESYNYFGLAGFYDNADSSNSRCTEKKSGLDCVSANIFNTDALDVDAVPTNENYADVKYTICETSTDNSGNNRMMDVCIIDEKSDKLVLNENDSFKNPDESFTDDDIFGIEAFMNILIKQKHVTFGEAVYIDGLNDSIVLSSDMYDMSSSEERDAKRESMPIGIKNTDPDHDYDTDIEENLESDEIHNVTIENNETDVREDNILDVAFLTDTQITQVSNDKPAETNLYQNAFAKPKGRHYTPNTQKQRNSKSKRTSLKNERTIQNTNRKKNSSKISPTSTLMDLKSTKSGSKCWICFTRGSRGGESTILPTKPTTTEKTPKRCAINANANSRRGCWINFNCDMLNDQVRKKPLKSVKKMKPVPDSSLNLSVHEISDRDFSSSPISTNDSKNYYEQSECLPEEAPANDSSVMLNRVDQGIPEMGNNPFKVSPTFNVRDKIKTLSLPQISFHENLLIDEIEINFKCTHFDIDRHCTTADSSLFNEDNPPYAETDSTLPKIEEFDIRLNKYFNDSAENSPDNRSAKSKKSLLFFDEFEGMFESRISEFENYPISTNESVDLDDVSESFETAEGSSSVFRESFQNLDLTFNSHILACNDSLPEELNDQTYIIDKGSSSSSKLAGDGFGQQPAYKPIRSKSNIKLFDVAARSWSWPPYEATLRYKIVNNFRMIESD